MRGGPPAQSVPRPDQVPGIFRTYVMMEIDDSLPSKVRARDVRGEGEDFASIFFRVQHILDGAPSNDGWVNSYMIEIIQ